MRAHARFKYTMHRPTACTNADLTRANVVG
jgi:hypothetical protein